MRVSRSEEHTSELQSPDHLVCRLLLEKKKNKPSHSRTGNSNYNPYFTRMKWVVRLSKRQQSSLVSMDQEQSLSLDPYFWMTPFSSPIRRTPGALLPALRGLKLIPIMSQTARINPSESSTGISNPNPYLTCMK